MEEVSDIQGVPFFIWYRVWLQWRFTPKKWMFTNVGYIENTSGQLFSCKLKLRYIRTDSWNVWICMWYAVSHADSDFTIFFTSYLVLSYIETTGLLFQRVCLRHEHKTLYYYHLYKFYFVMYFRMFQRTYYYPSFFLWKKFLWESETNYFVFVLALYFIFARDLKSLRILIALSWKTEAIPSQNIIQY